MITEQHVPQFRFKGFSDSWEQRKVSELADRYDNHRVPITASERVAGRTPYYGANGIQDHVEGFTHDGEFILVAEDGANDLQNYPVQYVDGKVWVNNHAHVLQAKEETADNKFLMNALKHTNIEPYLVGGGRAKLNADVMMKIDFKVPTLPEQIQIGKFFDNLDHLITLHQRKLELLKRLKQGYLQKLFPQNGENVPELRFKGYSDAWEKRKLGETNSYFTDGNYGESYPKESELSDKENGVPFLRGSNLRNGELIEDNANYITKEKHAELTSGHLVEDDIVLAVRGSLGALGYVKDENIDWNINSQLAVIRTDKSELSGKFLVQFLLSWRGQKELLSRNTGTALKQLPIKQLKDVPVPIVNLDEQKEIGALFSSIDNLIAATQHKVDLLKKLKQGYLQKMFC